MAIFDFCFPADSLHICTVKGAQGAIPELLLVPGPFQKKRSEGREVRSECIHFSNLFKITDHKMSV